jgi:hypothetical protein
MLPIVDQHVNLQMAISLHKGLLDVVFSLIVEMDSGPSVMTIQMLPKSFILDRSNESLHPSQILLLYQNTEQKLYSGETYV